MFLKSLIWSFFSVDAVFVQSQASLASLSTKPRKHSPGRSHTAGVTVSTAGFCLRCHTVQGWSCHPGRPRKSTQDQPSLLQDKDKSPLQVPSLYFMQSKVSSSCYCRVLKEHSLSQPHKHFKARKTILLSLLSFVPLCRTNCMCQMLLLPSTNLRSQLPLCVRQTWGLTMGHLKEAEPIVRLDFTLQRLCHRKSFCHNTFYRLIPFRQVLTVSFSMFHYNFYNQQCSPSHSC